MINYRSFIELLILLTYMITCGSAASLVEIPKLDESKEVRVSVPASIAALPIKFSDEDSVSWKYETGTRQLISGAGNLQGSIIDCAFWNRYLHMYIPKDLEGGELDKNYISLISLARLNEATKVSIIFYPAPLTKGVEDSRPLKKEDVYDFDKLELKKLHPNGFSSKIASAYEYSLANLKVLLEKELKNRPLAEGFFITTLDRDTLNDKESFESIFQLQSQFSDIVKSQGLERFKQTVSQILTRGGGIVLAYKKEGASKKPVSIAAAVPFTLSTGTRLLIDTLYTIESERHKGLALSTLRSLLGRLSLNPTCIVECETGLARVEERRKYDSITAPMGVAVRWFNTTLLGDTQRSND